MQTFAENWVSTTILLLHGKAFVQRFEEIVDHAQMTAPLHWSPEENGAKEGGGRERPTIRSQSLETTRV